MNFLTSVIEATEVVTNIELLQAIESNSAIIADAGILIVGFLLFFVVVCLCYFGYKFLRIFF